MSSTIYAKGSDIYDAFVRGAEEKYNRSTDDYSLYEADLIKSYEYLLKCAVSAGQHAALMRKTKGSWRNAYLPLKLALLHYYKAGEPADTHARVYLANDPFTFTDISLVDFFKLQESSPREKY